MNWRQLPAKRRFQQAKLQWRKARKRGVKLPGWGFDITTSSPQAYSADLDRKTQALRRWQFLRYFPHLDPYWERSGKVVDPLGKDYFDKKYNIYRTVGVQ